MTDMTQPDGTTADAAGGEQMGTDQMGTEQMTTPATDATSDAGDRPGDIPFDQAAAEHENPALE